MKWGVFLWALYVPNTDVPVLTTLTQPRCQGSVEIGLPIL